MVDSTTTRLRPEDGGDGTRGGLDVAEVGPMVGGHGGRDGEDEGVGGLGLGEGEEVPLRDRVTDRDIEIGLVDVDPALVDGPDRVGVRVDTEHLHPVGGQDARRRQTDITQTYHAHALDGHVWMRSLYCSTR